MTPTADLSFLSLITNASILVQLVMALLLAVSAMSWTYIFRKMFAIRSARAQTEEFERLFWSTPRRRAGSTRTTAARWNASSSPA